MSNKFIDGLTKICSAWLNTVDDAVFDALGSPKTAEDVRNNIGAQPTAPGYASVGLSGGWYPFPPDGGIAGQALVKQSDVDYDIGWGTIEPWPEGGMAGQLLAKLSSSYGDIGWIDAPRELPAGGSAGEVLQKASGNDWDVIWAGVSAPLAGLFIGDDPPSAPQPGALWMEATSGRTFVWYDDGTSIQWVLQSDPGVLAQGGGGSSGIPDVPLDGIYYARKDAGWVPTAVQTDAADALQYARVAGSWARLDHGSAAGLGDDDHLQYLTNGRGDARYSALGHEHDYLPLTGGALTGDLFLAGTPTLDAMAANKAYVDALIAGVGSGFPAGTVMLFQQSAAPTGWTKLTTHNDKALRVVSGSVGSGGSTAFSTVFGRTAVDGHVLSASEIPSHTHSFSATTGLSGQHLHNIYVYEYVGLGGNEATAGPGNSVKYQAKATDTQGSHSHSVSGTTGSAGSGGAHAHNVDLRVRYVDVILAQKD